MLALLGLLAVHNIIDHELLTYDYLGLFRKNQNIAALILTKSKRGILS